MKMKLVCAPGEWASPSPLEGWEGDRGVAGGDPIDASSRPPPPHRGAVSSLIRWCLFVMASAGGPAPGLALASPPTNPAFAPRISKLIGELPASFEANEGQLDRAVKFYCRGRRATLFLTSNQAVLRLAGPRQDAVLSMELAGGNRHPRLVGLEPQPAKRNYLLGNDPRHWHSGVPSYARVRYAGVYPGVDLVYRANQRQLEFDFVIAPGADPRRIRLAFLGADSLAVGSDGSLILHTANGEVVQRAPVVYQEAEEAGGRRRKVEGRYVLLAAAADHREAGSQSAARQVALAVGRYDRARPLIIDPVLAYSTFLGGSGDDQGLGIAVDGTGNAYIAGFTNSTVFPGIGSGSIQPANGGGLNDVFVTKIDAAGAAIVYSTFLGGSGDDRGLAIAVDGAGSAYVTGVTTSPTFPGVSASSIQPANGGGSDAFVTKINRDGTGIVYSTFLGGSDGDQGNGIAVDRAGNAYVTGQTFSATFPGVGGGSIQPASRGGGDAFVTKINAAGTAIVYSTFLGGSGFDFGNGIAVDDGGNVYVAGSTSSSTFPGVGASSIQPANGGGISDAFVTEINAPGTAIVYSTFLGGSDFDAANAIAVDGAGNAYVTGLTASTVFPGVSGSSIQPALGDGSQDAFVTKINPGGTGIAYSTFLGGGDFNAGNGIAVDGAGNAYVTGFTDGTSFPGVGGSSIQPANGGGDDAFVTKINAAGTAILYSTFLGGDGLDYGYAIAVDGAGSAYVTGKTSSTTFPGVGANSIQPVSGFGDDAFVAKLAIGAATGCVSSPTTLCLNNGRFAVGATFAAAGQAGTAQVVPLTPDTGYLWFFSSANVEAVVKVLDGCGVGGHYWVFASGLTNVNVVITVTDTQTGASVKYTNPPNTKFQPIQDTGAFASCP
jgi:hypothetical protein